MIMNSLYGRFGMDPSFLKYKICTPAESEHIIENNSDCDVIPLIHGGKVLVSYKCDESNSEPLQVVDVSVAISAAIAAYARVVMSHYLVKYEHHILCCDTDGIKVSCDIDPAEIDDKKLGMMKYEYTFTSMVSPGSKMYGGILKEPYKGLDEIVKVKGLKSPMSYYQLSTTLYINNPIKIEQEI